ncbi:hypothetical protein ABIE06_004309, partial [Pantoea dispersa]|uniref:hypothetical protein n=1 Tax=Pantoea dispersa TaxID=59814 RepID=UPI003D1E6359
GMARAIRCHQLNTKTNIINGSKVSRLSVAIQYCRVTKLTLADDKGKLHTDLAIGTQGAPGV